MATVLARVIKRPEESAREFKKRIASVLHGRLDDLPEWVFALGRYVMVQPGVLDFQSSQTWAQVHEKIPADECFIAGFGKDEALPTDGKFLYFDPQELDVAPVHT